MRATSYRPRWGEGFPQKLGLFIAALLLITVGYGGAQALRPTGAPVATSIDMLIPLVPIFVVPYALYFLFILVPWPVLWKQDSEYRRMALCFLIALVVSIGIYLAYQTSGPRADFAVTDGFTWLLAQVYGNDVNVNAFPSLHTSLSLLTALFVWRSHKRAGLIAGVLAVFIILSTVLTKQHGIIDVLGGLALGLAVYFVVTRRLSGGSRPS